jgi:hypothetical protein
MGLFDGWRAVSDQIYRLARTEWWLQVDDDTLAGADRGWVYIGLVALNSRLKDLIPNEVATKPSAVSAVTEEPIACDGIPLTPNKAAGASAASTGTDAGIVSPGHPPIPNPAAVGAKGLTRGSLLEYLALIGASPDDVDLAKLVDFVPDDYSIMLLIEIRKMYSIYEPSKLKNWPYLVQQCSANLGLVTWLVDLRSRHLSREFAFYDDPEWKAATSAVSTHVQTNQNQTNRGLRADGSSGPEAKRARIDWDTRVAEGIWTHRPTPSRTSGDSLAALLIAWHTTVQPLCIERCELNTKTGVHLRSITNTEKFIPNNMKYVTNLFKAKLLPEEEWFKLNSVKNIVEEMFAEACKQVRGRWQWRGFRIYDTERTGLVFSVLQAYILGSEYHAD